MDVDYVIIGASTAGSVLAAWLSEDKDVRVELLEAGSGTPIDGTCVTAADDKTLLRHTDSTYFHPGGICCIGSDNDTALDPDLQVRGVSELRVVDASAMPSPVAANTNATVPAVAERAASLIRGETS